MDQDSSHDLPTIRDEIDAVDADLVRLMGSYPRSKRTL